MFNNIYKNKKILITGHTGFKGSWLSLWLKHLGADVLGYSLSNVSYPNHFDLLNINIISILKDIRNRDELKNVVDWFKPDIIFHMAAQAIVSEGYKLPYETFEINVMGTASVLESCINYKPKAMIFVTTDKVYKNKEKINGYKEEDELGGYDPYSTSKCCSEFVIDCYRNCYFNDNETLISSVRAGNVIGGGDWANNRLIPDIVRGSVYQQPVIIRKPKAVRPFQHVLDVLCGYLLLGEKLLNGKKNYATSFNFGFNEIISVEKLLQLSKKIWKDIKYDVDEVTDYFHETNILTLNSNKAKKMLNWENKYNIKEALEKTYKWYEEYYKYDNIISLDQIKEYENKKTKKEIYKDVIELSDHLYK